MLGYENIIYCFKQFQPFFSPMQEANLTTTHHRCSTRKKHLIGTLMNVRQPEERTTKKSLRVSENHWLHTSGNIRRQGF